MRKVFSVVVIILMALAFMGCVDMTKTTPKSDTGIAKVTAEVKTGADGMTVEQRNIKSRIEAENDPGAIKHLYIISAYSGQTIMYSTVKGKVTSSGKRLTPYTVESGGDYRRGFDFYVNSERYSTPEVLQDDGTYGSSIPYLYWWDAAGRYHQHYVAGGQIVHVSDQPIQVKGVIIRIDNEDLTSE